ncbi:hypothetical protein [Hymenobacter metallicola]|uniref:Uncharacterized protein n=1 Tax=Hymenobacter metallicola TaxID=2563114 RepID=A0A4Z0QBY6_9BACT|nr:hypothetical protein [Hymenobacter metallicola]TGE27587.1 hypothetical protein E5K02_14545 [Hymenobacter metallicola]
MNPVFIRTSKFLGLLCVWLALAACKKDAAERLYCAPYQAPVPADTYVFPLVPGTPAWAELKTGAEMVQACQVPDATLKSMSTPGLIATCLSYPLLNNILAGFTLQRGTRSVLINFNGFGELSQRPQAAAQLLSRYQLMRASCVPARSEWGRYSLDFAYFELVMAQEEYVAQLSSVERRRLVQEALIKYAEKERLQGDIYGGLNLETAAFIMARVMQAERYAPFMTTVSTTPAVQDFIKEAQVLGRWEVLAVVVSHAQEFVK